MTKVCTRCHKSKDISNFHKDTRYTLGVFSWCKRCEQDCKNERYAKDKQKGCDKVNKWRLENKEAVKVIKKKAYLKRKLETGLTGYQSKESKAKSMAIYRDTHREELRLKSRERYYDIIKTYEGRLYWRAIVQRRRKAGNITAKLIKQIEKDNIATYGILTCEYCKKPIDKYHLEHMQPISKGGKSEFINLCISCPECNLSKGVLTADEFRKRLKVV